MGLAELPRRPEGGGMEARALLGLCDCYYLLTEILGRADMMWHGGPDLWARDQSGRNRAGKPVQRQLGRLALVCLQAEGDLATASGAGADDIPFARESPVLADWDGLAGASSPCRALRGFG